MTPALSSTPLDFDPLMLLEPKALLERLGVDWTQLLKETPAPPPLDWDFIKEVVLYHRDTPSSSLVLLLALQAVMKMAKFKTPDAVREEIFQLLTTASDPDFETSTAPP